MAFPQLIFTALKTLNCITFKYPTSEFTKPKNKFVQARLEIH